MADGTGSDSAQPPALLIDAHVHLHDCYVPARFFEQAAENFARAATAGGWPPLPGALMLTESAGVDWFGQLEAGGVPTAPWRIERGADSITLTAVKGERRLLLVAGRQVVAREGLEVLLLGTRATVAERRPIREILAEGEHLGALRVIPWGAGKWLFGRGRLLDELVDAARPGDGFFLGDSGGRPFFWTAPRHFTRVAQRGVRILPGTDPLPFPDQTGRPGSYGFRLEWPGEVALSGETLKTLLRGSDARLTPYGRLERLVPFVRNQLAMQRRKRDVA
jgi:hypothetical protein